jgi:putative acetyltransferase
VRNAQPHRGAIDDFAASMAPIDWRLLHQLTKMLRAVPLEKPRMSAVIARERADSADAVMLITELEADLEPLYPRASRHGYSVEQLIAESVAFFVLRDGETPAGCGGILLVGTEYGELKRMYVRPQFRGRGFGTLLVDHLADHARAHGVGLLRLETGIHQTAAIRLYERMGFQRIPPFADYDEDPLSLYYEKRIM